MTDKVQLIKQEILRRKQTWSHQDKQYERGGKDMCDYLLGFIDSISEEPKGLWDSKKIIKFIKDNVREYHKSGVFHVDDFINDLTKTMEK